ncbi:MAG: hypothetical protein GYA24_08820 [Candidatus Lokiarchaeota archaeon]|nr:hypothetical protein [Candidatus Lokiarchaeota archaeon]
MSAEERKALNVQCPVCNAKQDVEVPTRIIKENIKGVSTIAINAQCGHSFHIFVDKNFAIRGYQRSDFDVTATAVEPTETIQNYSLPGIVKMFGEEPFALAMRAILLNQKAILIGSDQQILKSLFINFISLFEQELQDSADAIEIMSKEEFEHQNPLQYNTNLVIDLDFSVVKNNPFQNEKVKIEKELLKQCLAVKSIDQQKDELKKRISRIFLYTNVMLNFIYQGMDNFKDIKNTMKKKDKNINQDELDLAFSIATSRYTKLLK